MDWVRTLIEQLEWHWDHQLRPRMEGLTDEEYLWEPVAGCWSLRPRAESTTAMAAGSGAAVADFEFPEPEPAPLTTIAWRMGHLSVGVFGARAASHFGGPPMDYETTEWSLTAADGLALLDRTHDAWISGVGNLDDADMERPCGPAEGPFADEPMAALVLHVHREAIHHGAEISLLRDLHLRMGSGERAA